MKYSIILAAMLFAGCSSNPQIEYVPVTKYVVRTAPSDLKQLPTRLPSADTRITTDDQAAHFVSSTETYIQLLETKIEKLIEFFERPVTNE